jgi:hypothetical protein
MTWGTSGGTAIAYASVTSAGNTTTTEITTVGTEIADPATTYAGITTTTLDQIDQFYTAIDYGPPPTLSPAAIAQYEAEGPAQVISAIENSSYTLNVVDQIIREYQAAFNRVPDQAGEAHWVHQLGAGAISLNQLSTAFASSTEFAALHGGATATTPANTTLVTAMYENVLQRAPDAGGLAFWVSSGLNAAQLLQTFAQSSEFIADTTPHIIAYQNAEPAGTPPTVGSLLAATTADPPAVHVTGVVDAHSALHLGA